LLLLLLLSAAALSPCLPGLPCSPQVDLSDNQLTGSVPAPWQQGTGNAGVIASLYLHSNLLEGALPALALKSLVNASLHDNLLTGELWPRWVAGCEGGWVGAGENRWGEPCKWVQPSVCIVAYEGTSAACLSASPIGRSRTKPATRPPPPLCLLYCLPSCAGSIPSSWQQAPDSAAISILPQQGGGLCGAVPSSPKLLMVTQPGSWYPVANSLGSCFASNCSNIVQSEWVGWVQSGVRWL